MIYALDSNIVSYMLKGDSDVIAHYRKAFDDGGDFVIPPVSLGSSQKRQFGNRMCFALALQR